jgi:hypothetical protein
MQTTDARQRLRTLGQYDLGAWVEAATGNELWSKQREIASGLSVHRARLAVPSCNASGKTFLAARLALAFYDVYTPGTPCLKCDPDGTKGGCRGSKVLTTSSKETHLKDNLWGEIRMTIAALKQRGIEMPGTLPPEATFLLDNHGNHFLRGQVATKEEGFQGYHAAHKLIIGDEATSVGEDVARGITSLMATADTRLLLIFNPTTPDTYAAQMTRSERVQTIKITAFDTPHFTGEHVPDGSNLTTPEFLEDLKAQGMGPGSYEWTTRVQADFWTLGDDVLIPEPWVDRAIEAAGDEFSGQVALGVDLASYGSNESTIAVRRGDTLSSVTAYPAGRTDHFIIGPDGFGGAPGPVRRAVMDNGPWLLIFDADGVGAGAVGDFDRLHKWAVKNGYMKQGSTVIGFRGAKKIMDAYHNARSAWWWSLRKRFERPGGIYLRAADALLRKQLSQLTYKITPAGAVRVETKDEMRSRGLQSPDRADAVMYAFAFSEDLPDPNMAVAQYVVSEGYVGDHSEAAMWGRMAEHATPKDTDAVFGIPDEL